jgi:hypothetical protein
MRSKEVLEKCFKEGAEMWDSVTLEGIVAVLFFPVWAPFALVLWLAMLITGAISLSLQHVWNEWRAPIIRRMKK